ncbi:MAG: hypothetical protein LBP91_06195, partial [Coriobacteriales bacterium]|nr:hypothetical protein [Coriobacteriales bacterium]
MDRILIYSANAQIAKELISASRLIGEATALVLEETAALDLAACGVDVLHSEATGARPADTAAMAELIALAVEHLGASVVLLSSDRRGKELAG